jgi:hypothetical protein
MSQWDDPGSQWQAEAQRLNGLVVTTMQQADALRARVAQLEEALSKIMESTDGTELNLNNYSREQVAAVNQAAVDAYLIAEAALSTPPGEWTQGWMDEQRRLAKAEAFKEASEWCFEWGTKCKGPGKKLYVPEALCAAGLAFEDYAAKLRQRGK